MLNYNVCGRQCTSSFQFASRRRLNKQNMIFVDFAVVVASVFKVVV